ncbi:ATP-dependent RNA helicase DHX57, putative [Plasmodium vivax]|uniref:ATP-dependent RNA helicase DHX57, putative n=1 Tax=Plasmodium vivax TaxID=5855 RepID=A0A564ZUR2_PLAVI|nr:ATP-dependent RNA helicase DHX57, putative [Plasmodium vivax]
MNGEEDRQPNNRLQESIPEGYHHQPVRRPNEPHFGAPERGPSNVPCEGITGPLPTYYHQENDGMYLRQETLLARWGGHYHRDSFNDEQSWGSHRIGETPSEHLGGGHHLPSNSAVAELPYRDAHNAAIFNSFVRVPLNVDHVAMSRALPRGASMQMNSWSYHPSQSNQHMVRADHHPYAGIAASVASSSAANSSGGFPTGYDPRAVGGVHPSVGFQQGYTTQQGYPPRVDNPTGARESYCALPGNHPYGAEQFSSYSDRRRGSFGQYGSTSGGEHPLREAVNRQRYQPGGGGVVARSAELRYGACADEGDYPPYGVSMYQGGERGNRGRRSHGGHSAANRFQKARPAAASEGKSRPGRGGPGKGDPEKGGPGKTPPDVAGQDAPPTGENKILLTEDSQKSAQRNIQKLSIYNARSEILRMIEQNDITFIQGETGSGKSTCVPKFLLEHSLKEGREKINIIVTEPRRIACISLSRILSELMNDKLGNTVGYRIAGEAVYDSEKTLVTYITIGFLFKLFLHHRNMYRKFTHVIIDEIHDRSILLDIVLLFIKVYLHTRRKDEEMFKLVIMSATMQSNLFHAYFEHESISMGSIFIGTKIYSIDTFYIEDIIRYARGGVRGGEDRAEDRGELGEGRAEPRGDCAKPGGDPPRRERVIEFILRQKNRKKLHLSGGAEALLQRIKNEYDKSINLFNSKNAKSDCKRDIDVEQIIPANVFSNISELCLELVQNLCLLGDSVLIFLSGMQDITDMYHQLCLIINNNSKKQHVRFHIHILHSCLYDNTIHKLHESDRDSINIFLSSNIAESSITIPNVRLVIDFCIQKNIEYNSERRAHILVKKWINKSSMEQRKGRCGRTCHGICIRMISKKFLNLLRDHKVSEIYTHSLHLLYLYILKSMSVLSQLIRGPPRGAAGSVGRAAGSTGRAAGSTGRAAGSTGSASPPAGSAAPPAGAPPQKLSMYDVLSMIIEQPSREKIRSTRHELEKMKAIIKVKDKLVISIIGQIMIRFNMSINLCRLLLFGVVMNVTFDAIIITAIINTNDIFPSFNLFTSKSVYSYGVSLEVSLKQKQYFDGRSYSEPIMLRNVFIEWLCVFSLYVQDLKNQNTFDKSHVKTYHITTCTLMSKRNHINAKKLLCVVSSVNSLCKRLLKILSRSSNAYRSAVYLLNLLKGEVPPTRLDSGLQHDGGGVDTPGDDPTDETLNAKNVFRIVTKYSCFDPSNENLYLKFLFTLAFTPLFIHGSPHLPLQNENERNEKKAKGKKLLALLNYMTQQKLNVKNCIYFRGPYYHDLNILRKALFIMCPYLSLELLQTKNFYVIHFFDRGGVNGFLNESLPSHGGDAHRGQGSGSGRGSGVGSGMGSGSGVGSGMGSGSGVGTPSCCYGVLVGPELRKVLPSPASAKQYEGAVEKIRRELLHMYGRDTEKNIFQNFHDNIVSVIQPVQAIVPVHLNQMDEINNAALCTHIINMFSSGRTCFSIPLWRGGSYGGSYGGSHHRSGASRVSNYFNHHYEMNKPKHLFLVKWTLLNTDNYKISKKEKAERELRRQAQKGGLAAGQAKRQPKGLAAGQTKGQTEGDRQGGQCEEEGGEKIDAKTAAKTAANAAPDEAPPKGADQEGANQEGANSEEQGGEAAARNGSSDGSDRPNHCNHSDLSDCSNLSSKGKQKKMKCNLSFRSVLGFLSLCPFEYDAQKRTYRRQTQDIFAVCSSIDYSCTNDTYTWVNYATVIPNRLFLSFFLSALPYHDNVILNTRTNLRGLEILSVKIFDSKEIVIRDVRKRKSKGGGAATAEGGNRGGTTEATGRSATEATGRSATEANSGGTPTSPLTINKYDLLRINYLRYCMSSFLFFLTWVYNKRDEEEHPVGENRVEEHHLEEHHLEEHHLEGHHLEEHHLEEHRLKDAADEPDEYFSEDDAVSDVEENRVLRESPYISRVIRNLIKENNREEINYEMYAVGSDADGESGDGGEVPTGRGRRRAQFNPNFLHASDNLVALDEAWNGGKGAHLLKTYGPLHSYLSSPNDPSLVSSSPREKCQTCLSSVKKSHLNNNFSLQILLSLNAYAKGCTSEEFLFFNPINLGPMEDLSYRLRCMYYEESAPEGPP